MYETRVVRVYGVFAAVLGLLALRAFTLQVANRTQILDEHERRVHGRFVLAPRRGEIQWQDGAPIAWNEPGFSIEIDLPAYFAKRWRCGACGAAVRRSTAPGACKDCGAAAEFTLLPMPDAGELARLCGVTEETLDAGLVHASARRELHPEFRTFELLGAISREAAMAVALSGDRFPGITVRARAGRQRDDVAASVVGATRPAWPEDLEERRDPERAERGERVYSAAEVFSMRFGKSGLEATFDDALRGDPGRAHRTPRKGSGGGGTKIDLPVVDGVTLRTTLRRNVQALANDVVAAAPGDAAAVVVDVTSGAVVAIASKSKDGHQHAVVSMRPGSVFKLVTALALLEAGVSPDESVTCRGAGKVASGAKYVCDEVHGSVALREAFAHSCNAYFATMADRIGPAAMLRATRELGLDVNPELHLKGSPAGLDPIHRDGSRWHPADMAKIGIGQGKALVSPLQVAIAYARIAAGGRAVTPWLVEREAPPRAAPDPSLAQFAPLLADCARRVVVSGTGSKIRELAAIEAAGKTGTGDVNSDGSLNNAWFVAFAPASSPRYVAAVVYERVKQHGSEVAARPVARLLAEALK